MRRTYLIAVALLALVALALAACGGNQEPAGEEVAWAPTETETPVEEPAPAPAATETPAEEPTQAPAATETHVEEAEHADAETEAHSDDAAVAEGLALFRAIGCAGCHGQDGEGGVGPAIPGHTAEQVRRQVRAPVGDVMPAYSEEQLSDGQLDRIIAWVESLGPATGDHDHAHEHEEEAGSEQAQAGDAAAHLRLAFFAVKDGNAHDAEHHLEDLVAVLEDEHARTEAEEILTSLQAGADLHDIEHEMEHLMEDIGSETGALDGANLHLQLALDSLTLGDQDAASLHLEHYAESVDDADLAAEAEELRAHLEEGDLHAVEEGVQALLTGQEPDHQD